MTHKIADLVVKTGEYQKDGETKGRYENVGSMMQGDNGQFMILKRTFNPAGVPNPDCKDSVIVSCFEKQENNNQAPQQQAPQQQYQQQSPQQQNQSMEQQAGHSQPQYSDQPPQQYGGHRS
ncbi:MAG: hypothetical protein JKY81_04640 [Colwellia sp.]|nr:hypothetical protein [Colwellia sp.]